MLSYIGVQIITCIFLSMFYCFKHRSCKFLNASTWITPFFTYLDNYLPMLVFISFLFIFRVITNNIRYNMSSHIIKLSFIPHSVKVLYLMIIQSSRPIYKFPILMVSFGLLLLLSFIIFQSPFLLLISVIVVSCIPLLTLIPAKWKVSSYSKALIKTLIHFLVITGNMKYFFFIYQFWHSCLTYKGFKGFTIMSTLSVLFYMIVSRYIFYLRIEHLQIPMVISFLYFMGMFFLFLRFLTNISFFIIPYTFQNHFNEAEIMLTEIPEVDDLVNKPTPPLDATTAEKPTFRGWFNFHSHRHYYLPEMPKGNFYRNCGLGLATAGLCISAYACYNYRISALAAIQQAEAADKQAKAAVKQNDLTALQMGLINKEEYYRRHTEDKP